MTKFSGNSFASRLLHWHSTIDRNLPWKSSNNPYTIWLSEIIMQQTRVAQGTPYYLKFIEAFPTIIDLANAEEDQVMKLWQGLGYYSRARNLHTTAKTVRDQYKGIFPKEYKDILALKGIGKYTAAAIASFAYGQEYPVVDGNVIRVISRYFGITAPVDVTETIKEINQKASQLIKGSNPADYNQAIMDFGALMCTPKSPNCIQCPLKDECIAFDSDQVSTIPYKSKKVKKRDRFFHYLIISDEDRNVILNYRGKKDIWQSLFDFPLIENQKKDTLSSKEISQFVTKQLKAKTTHCKLPTKMYKHILSHQTIFGQFYEVAVQKLPKEVSPYTLTHMDKIDSFALPRLIHNYVEDNINWSLF